MNAQRIDQTIDQTIVVGPLQCNCRLLACPRTGEAVLIDPGADAEFILKEIQSKRALTGLPLRVKYLFHTHAHFDHIGATRAVCEGLKVVRPDLHAVSQAKIALHRGDEQMYQALPIQLQMFGFSEGDSADPLPIDHYFEDGEQLNVGDLKFSVIHTPGHSPGGVCLRLHEDSSLGVGETVFSGDTLFQGSVGRTDLWGSDADQMFSSIKKRLLILDDDTRVCPGHGPETCIGIEKRQNPFL